MPLLISRIFTPLRLYCLLNILGDVCVVLSGMVYTNPARTLAALLGASTHILGIMFPNIKINKTQMVDLIMGIVVICGVLYMLSGSNILGFEDTPRYSEILGGLFLSAAAICIIIKKSKTATLLFLATTTAFTFSAFEVFFIRGEPDWWVFTGAAMFYSAAFVARYLKK